MSYIKSTGSGGTGVSRSSSGVTLLGQPRRQRVSEGQASIGFGKLLHLSEEYKTQNIDDDLERHKKAASSDETVTSGDVSPAGTLIKSRSSAAKLNQSSAPNNKEKEKVDILRELLDLWAKDGLPEMPALISIGMPKYGINAFNIDDHWSSFIDCSNMTHRQKEQQETLWELLTTEVEYIRSLYVIHDLFMCCLLHIQNEQVLNEIDLQKMFANITELATIHSEFWINDLSRVLDSSRQNHCSFDIGMLKPAFLTLGERFKPYVQYCVEQVTCLEYVKKSYQENALFRVFVNWAEAQKQCNRLKLHDLLVKPMQRITRYSLLLRAIGKKTDDNGVKQDLLEMAEHVDKFVTSVNQTLSRKHEKEKLEILAARLEAYDALDYPLVDSECVKILNQNYMTLDLMAPMPGCGQNLRCVLMEGPLKLRDTNNKVDVYCLLFTDMLLFTKPSKRDKLRIVKPPIRTDSLSIYEMRESAYLMLVHLTDFGVAQAAYTLQGDNIGKWAKHFKKAQHLYMKAKEQARKEVQPVDDLDLDEEGFSGPLERKPSDSAMQPVDNYYEYVENSTKTILAGIENNDLSERTMSRCQTSPDIGRKHNTLPPNYKHNKAYQSDGYLEQDIEILGSIMVADALEKPHKKKLAARRRRVHSQERYHTDSAINEIKHDENSSNDFSSSVMALHVDSDDNLEYSSESDRLSAENFHPADAHVNSAFPHLDHALQNVNLVNCSSTSSSSNSLAEYEKQTERGTNATATVKSKDRWSWGADIETSSPHGVEQAASHVLKDKVSAADKGKGRRLSQRELQKYKLLLIADPTVGVEI